jgi:hypothetical protein
MSRKKLTIDVRDRLQKMRTLKLNTPGTTTHCRRIKLMELAEALSISKPQNPRASKEAHDIGRRMKLMT